MSDISHRIKKQLLLTLLLLLSACQPVISATRAASEDITPTAAVRTERTSQPTISATVEPTYTSIPCSDTKGRILIEEIPSETQKVSINAKIYLPPCYTDTGEPYPVLYMLHGMTNTNDQWERLGVFTLMDDLIDSDVINPFIIVLPNENNSNKPSNNSSYGEALIKDVLPYIEKRFNSCTTRSCRAIGGLSRGGNWAVRLGVSYPEKFTAVGAHSTPLFYGEISNIQKAVEKAVSPANLPTFFIDVGDRDEDKLDVFSFVETLNELEVPYIFTEYIGYHDEAYWGAHLNDYLLWYSSQITSSAKE